MLKSVLIANRGEIACRIIRTAQRLGMRTIAVYSDADCNAAHVAAADAAYRIGPAPASESYLAVEKIISVALEAGARSVHPGYGFLSESAEFAEACAAAGLVFIGPSPAAIRAMGLKDSAKALMQKAGVPIVPGYHGGRQEADFLARKAREIGYPVLVKAVAGGGGKGMRRVDRPEDFKTALESARREAQSAFGNADVLIEKYVNHPRHIEFQIFGDAQGNVVHLYERDCSLQRRHQKVIEEAPAPGMTEELRTTMGGAAIAAAKAVGYVGAGTVEFIVEGAESLDAARFFFMEMNTRLQVEHPVTEAVTGVDLVEWQFRIASGEKLPLAQSEIALRGHAIEARLYAEDPEHSFLPSTGRLWALRLPEGPGLRVDAGVAEGDDVTPFYDPMIAKIIAHADTRKTALDRLALALRATCVAGPRCNLAFLTALAEAEDFRSGRFDTGFIDARIAELGAVEQPPDSRAIKAGARRLFVRQASEWQRADFADPWQRLDGFSFSEPPEIRRRIKADGKLVEVVQERDFTALPRGIGAEGDLEIIESPSLPETVFVLREGRQTEIGLYDPLEIDAEAEEDGNNIVFAPLHGKLVALLVASGDRVAKGQRLAVIEAMKMEHALVAPCTGRVAEISVAAGAQVQLGAKIVVIHAEV
jgi:3-methylcrotonyl-CoA carboxylase alpha subunit